LLGKKGYVVVVVVVVVLVNSKLCLVPQFHITGVHFNAKMKLTLIWRSKHQMLDLVKIIYF